MASDGETSCANDPNFAAIYSFLKVFGKLYGLELPTIVKLQEFIENTEEVSYPLKELHLRLLRRALKSAHSDRWEKCMIKFCHQLGHHQEAWEIERFSYKKASTQVKLKVLKYLLEYQFTCHPKFKTAVNVIPSKELRLDPIGRDKNGCVYWLQVDAEANLCLYKEDQDEETWQLIARSREELVKVIGQLKSGEEISPSNTCTENEGSSGPENAPEPPKPEIEDENEEEFLSPESESEHEELEADQKKNVSECEPQESSTHESDEKDEEITEEDSKEEKKENSIKSNRASCEQNITPCANENSPLHSENILKDSIKSATEDNDITDDESIDDPDDGNELNPSNENEDHSENIIIENKNNVNIEDKIEDHIEDSNDKNIESSEPEIVDSNLSKTENMNTENKTENTGENQENLVGNSKKDHEEDKEVGEAIEEPVMVVTGEGNGADCESFFLGEEISEEVMYFFGEGCGYDNDTGNPEAITETKEAESEGESDGKELVNGEHEASNTNAKISNIQIKAVAKRTLKKLTNDNSDVKPDTKKPCVRDLDKSNSSITDIDLKRESSVNDKSTTDSESPRKSKEAKDSETVSKKNNVKKRKSKVKKKSVARKLQVNDVKEEINSVSETDNCQDKTNIIEKRKSSVSSVDQDDLADVNNKEKSLQEDPLAIEPLPPKKSRLESTPESNIDAAHSKNPSDAKDRTSDDAENENNSLNDSVSKRKKIKATKGKFKRKFKVQNKGSDKNIDKVNDRGKKGNKSLKRSLVEATMSDKNKSESQSESEDNEPITSGKRLKIKPKKIITSTRKKIEAKLLEKQSTDESEEETLYSLAGKKSATKKLVKKKKPKSKEKCKEKPKSKLVSDDSDTPVRQSRRIAQQKIKEEAERRHQEEVALRELKMNHKKKGKEEEEEEEWEWRASGRSSSEEDRKRSHKKSWRTCDSTGPEADSDSDSPLFDLQPEPEPEPDYGKSDHEFSPESDLETDEPAEPVKRARTLQEEKDDGFCKQCGSGEQPEWILLCDSCDSGYHASCLKPLLFYIPQGDWFCPPCNHEKLIASLESELVKFDELMVKVEEERAKKKLEEPEPESEEVKKEKEEDDDSDDSSCSSGSSGSSGGVYRLRARRQLPVSLRAQEYDRLISAAIKEEYVEPTSSAGNQGRGKDISTIIEAAEEEKMKAEREAIEQGKPVDSKKSKKKQRKKTRKLNSLDVPSEDDDETDEDFKDTGAASSSEEISSSAERDTGTGTESRSSDSLPIRRTARTEHKKDRPKMTESSPEVKKKKKNVFDDSSSESAGAKEWSSSSKPKSKSHHHHHRPKDRSKKRDKSKKSRRSRGLTQYDADGNVIRARVTYGGLSGDEGENDWSPKHRTRQKKINYTEMPNTESEDEMHKSSGKHMADSSDEFKITESESSESEGGRRRREEERMNALADLITKSAVVPLEKLPEEITKAKTEEMQAHLNAQAAAAANARPVRGKGSRGGRGSRGSRGRGGGRGGAGGVGAGGGGGGRVAPPTDDALAKLVGLKVKELRQDTSPMKPNQIEREKKRQEREAKLAEKEAKRQERLQKREEKEKLKEQKAKEREEKKLAKIALQESKRIKKEKEYTGPMGYGPPPGAGVGAGLGAGVGAGRGDVFPRAPAPHHDQRFPNAPRLQVRAELRGMLSAEDRGLHAQQHHAGMREGTLSVAGSPQPFKPVSEEPSIITRMPHMINHQYRVPMMYPNNAGYPGPRGGQNMYLQGRQPYPQYYRLPHGPDQPYTHHMQGPGGPPTSMHHGGQPGGPMHHPPGFGYRGPPPASMSQGHLPDQPGASPNSLGGHPNPHGGPPNLGGPPNHQGPPSHLGQPNQLGGSPNLAGLGPRSGPPNPLGGPPGPPDALRGPPDVHRGPPDSLRGPPESFRGPPDSLRGPPESIRGPPDTPRGPGQHNPLGGPPDPLRGPPNMGGPPNLIRPNAHGVPPDGFRGPPNPHMPPNIQSGPPTTVGGPNSLGGPNAHGALQMGRGSPVAGPSGMKHGAPLMSGAPGPPGMHDDEPPIKIKAEVKMEPEYRSPASSPGANASAAGGAECSGREDAPRHPKIKHTENKDRRPRFPLGPYAPHYAPFGPYAPPHYAPDAHHAHHTLQYLSAERERGPASDPRGYLPAHMRPYPGGPAPHLPPHSQHPVPSQSLPRAPRPPAPRPPSPHRAPRAAHPQPAAVSGLPPHTGHPLPQPPPTKHLRLPDQPTPLLHPRPRTPATSPPLHPPLHQPYVQQAQALAAPMLPSRPTPPPAPSPHAAHMMSQPPSLPRCTPPPPGARSPPTLSRERASPSVPVQYQYPDRRPPGPPQPIPRDPLPPHPSPRRRDFDRAEPLREFERPEFDRRVPDREFGPPEPRRFERPDPRREFESPRRDFDAEPRLDFERPEQRRNFERPELRREFEHPEPRREFVEHPEPRREFEHPEPRREFEHPAPRREFEHAEPRRELELPESRGDFERPPHRREFPEVRPQFELAPPKEAGAGAGAAGEPDSTIPIKTEPSAARTEAAEAGGPGEPGAREEGGVFGGLVSYFSSQHEDDIDA